MSPRPIAQHYALALLEAARDTRKVSEVEQDMKVLSRLLAEVPGVSTWCRQGRVHHKTGLTFVRTVFLPYVGALTARALLLAADYRLEVIPELPSAFETVIGEGEFVCIKLEAAHVPDTELVQQVKETLEARTGKPAIVKVTIVPDLLAGFRVFWNDRMIDLSARGRWQALRTRLKTGGLR